MSYPLSTAEAVLRRFKLGEGRCSRSRFLLSIAEAVLRLSGDTEVPPDFISIVYR